MGQSVIYPYKGDKLAILTIREHLCGFYEIDTRCVEAAHKVDQTTQHAVCLGCNRITVDSGLRVCDFCETEYIDLSKHEDSKYETICPNCKDSYGV